jgi:FemAB-related protein (PEP-CTERM system-associated)
MTTAFTNHAALSGSRADYSISTPSQRNDLNVSTQTWTKANPLAPADRAEWDAYVAGHAGGTVFHSTTWLDILDRSYQRPYHHIAVKEDGRIRGLVSLYDVRGLSGKKSLYSLPFTAYGGMLTDGPEIAKVLHNACAELCRNEGAGMVHLRNTVPSGLDLPESDLNVQFSKPLPETEEACLESIPRKSRATVRKSIANHGLTYVVNRDVDLLWHLHAVNLKKLGTPVFPRSFFRTIMEVMGDKADILFAMHQGKAVAGVMNFYFRDVCNPYFSGSLPESNGTGANNYMYYALMCHGLKRGCKQFDFGKSRKGSGSFDFKKNMGFEPKPLPFQFIFNTRSELPSFNPSNPKLRLLLEVWSRQPLWTSKIAGPILNRFLP